MAETNGTRDRIEPHRGDIDEALTFYGRLLQFTLCGKSKDAAFIDLGDQFIALQEGRRQPGESGRAN